MNTQKPRLFQKLEIGVASPKQIREWAERFLPNGETVGEVTSWETVNYKTLKPEPNGLFCQKIFGPVVDFTCACGKKTTKADRKTEFFVRGFCPKCGVERTHSRVRRYRLGYIKLKQPVVHPLYASQRPSPLGLCLNWPTKRVQSVMRTSEFCCLPQNLTIFRTQLESTPKKILNWKVPFKTSTSFFSPKKMKEVFDSQNSSSEEIPLSPFKKENPAHFLSDGNKTKPVFTVLSGDQKGYYLTKLQRIPAKTQKKAFLTNFALFRQKQKPRLFLTFGKKNQNRPLFMFNAGSSEAKLYGISYDATWRQVEEFQEFLFYLWEQSFSYESSIPYYAFTKFVETHSREIPRHEQSYAIQTGGFALQHILSHLDLRGLQSEIRACSVQGQGALLLLKEKILGLDFKIFEHRKEIKRVRIKINRLQQLLLKWKRQLEIFRDFELGNMEPAWMILSYLPVLPPGLRPITSIRGELVVSDINSLYRKVLIRNKRIHRGSNFGVFDTALSGSWLSWCYNVRQVQEAVDELLKTGSVESGRPLKSLLEGLKGKQGRFRQHLLGKRVDYSGRSVIVVGPELKIHQCGLPKNMAIELFQPFLIQKLRKKGIVFTTTAAKALIAERKPIVWSLLGEILKTHPVLLNRAPTLHRLGIQAFLPQLTEGKAILLHPLVCPAFNADFDGDQMAVHVPLSAKTRAEALDLLWSRNHILAPASGQPLLLPTQDMVLGFYYLTCSKEKNIKSVENLIPSWKTLGTYLSYFPKGQVDSKWSFSKELCKDLHSFSPKRSSFEKNALVFQKNLGSNVFLKERKGHVYFSDFSDVKMAYDRGTLSLHTPIWVKWPGFVQTFVSEQNSLSSKFWGKGKENVLETRIDLYGRRETLFLENCHFFPGGATWEQKSQFVRTTPGRVLMNSLIFSKN